VNHLPGAAYDLTHFFAGLMLVTSFALIYQDRMLAVLRTFALQAVLLAIVVAWEAWVQDRPHLFITAALAFGLKGIIIPMALHRMIFKLQIHRDVEKVVSVGMTMMCGLGLTALSFMLVLKATAAAPAFAREGLAIALAIILIGLLMMITRRNALTQIIGFMSIENGLILGATGAKGMPLVVEISVAFSVLIALFVFAVFVFRIRERFDTVDVAALERVRGDRS
jgi:hydrogenase-4 component E